MLPDLNTGTSNGKHLVASLFGKGAIVIIGVIVCLAIIAAVVIYTQKMKKDNQGDNDDE